MYTYDVGQADELNARQVVKDSWMDCKPGARHLFNVHKSMSSDHPLQSLSGEAIPITGPMDMLSCM